MYHEVIIASGCLMLSNSAISLGLAHRAQRVVLVQDGFKNRIRPCGADHVYSCPTDQNPMTRDSVIGQ